MTIGGRSLVATPSLNQRGNVSTGSTLVGGVTWPLRGSRPLVPIQEWQPSAQLGFAWGQQYGTSWDIVVLVQGSNGSIWAAEFGGQGSGLLTDTTEPDWTDTPPIVDNDYTWYPVPVIGFVEWEPNMVIDTVKFIYKEGYGWASYPGFTGNAGGSEPDWAAALGANPIYDADFVADGDTYWWPFPPAEVTVNLDPGYGHGLFKSLRGLDGVRTSDGDETHVTSALTSDRGIRFDQGGGSISMSPSGTGEDLVIIRHPGFGGEGSEGDQSIGGRLVILSGGNAVLLLESQDDTTNLFARVTNDVAELTGTPVLVLSSLNSSAPDLATPLGPSQSPALAFWVNEAANKLMFRVLYADGSTQKSGEIALT